MIVAVVCDQDEQERKALCTNCRAHIAQESDEKLQLVPVPSEKDMLHHLEQSALVNLLYYRFLGGQVLDGLRVFRRQFRDAMLMLIAEDSVSPLEYLRPGIQPDALIIRPYDNAALDSANEEFLRSYLERFREKDLKNSFQVYTREETLYIPYSRIYYFEARDKKLYVRTKNQEYAFYDTIEALESRLPETFKRCHRSYIVNTEKIFRVMNADNYLDLGGGIGVPMSRSYRAAFKEMRP